MIKEVLRSVPPEKVATEAQIIDSIERLTQADTVRLEKYAKYRIRTIDPRAADGRDHEDLLQHAFTQFLSGDRKWNRDKPFTAVLLWAVKSISNHWAAQWDPEQPKTESELIITRDDGSEHNPFKEIAAGSLDPVRQIEIKQILERIDMIFDGDDEAQLVIDGWRRQMSGPEIKEDLGLSQTELETIIRRIRRTVTKEFEGDYV